MITHTLDKSLSKCTKILEVGRTHKIKSLHMIKSLIIGTGERVTGNIKVKHFIFQLIL